MNNHDGCCDNCGREYHLNNGHPNFCPSCAIAECENCGKMVGRDDAVILDTGEVYCCTSCSKRCECECDEDAGFDAHKDAMAFGKDY